MIPCLDFHGLGISMLKLEYTIENIAKIIKVDRIIGQNLHSKHYKFESVLIKTMKKLNEECPESFRDVSFNN